MKLTFPECRTVENNVVTQVMFQWNEFSNSI